jgi:hypothetical protein
VGCIGGGVYGIRRKEVNNTNITGLKEMHTYSNGADEIMLCIKKV